jgi:hypothetical protein
VAAPLAGGVAVSVAVGAGVGATLVGAGAVGVASAVGADGVAVGAGALGRWLGLGVREGVGLGRSVREGDGFADGEAGRLVTGVTSTGLGVASGRGGRTHR